MIFVIGFFKHIFFHISIEIDIGIGIKKLVIQPSPANPLHIDEVSRGDILGGDIFTTRSTTQGKRRHQVIEHPSHSTLRGRRIDDNPSGVDQLTVLGNNFFIIWT